VKDFAPAAERNQQPICDLLTGALPVTGTVLEVASGTGQHVVAFARAFPHLTWQPSDVDPASLDSISAHLDEARPPNVQSPLLLDASAPDWPVAAADAIVTINMIHIAPWACCLGLLAGAGRLLPSGGLLYLYGPYRVDGAFTAPSNAAFDERLRAMDPRWGVRELREVERAANRNELALERVVDMPANNLSVLFRRT